MNQEIFKRTENHPLFKSGKVEYVPIEWIMPMVNMSAGYLAKVDTAEGGVAYVAVEELWQDISENGMRDPFVITVGAQTQNYRLERGNHRLQKLYRAGVKFIPTTVLVLRDCRLDPEMDHAFADKELLVSQSGFDSLGLFESFYAAPSKVFKELKSCPVAVAD